MPILLSNEDYTVGWICALPVELAAAQTVLDERHEPLPARAGDANVYAYGRIHDHNVVVACLPAGLIGTNSAASVAMHMHRSFGCLRFALMVGIGGGVPSKAHDIRLGDVVVGQPVNGYGGVIQYDFGKSRPNGFERTGFLNAPPAILLSAVSMIRAKHSSAPGAPSSHMLEKGNIATSARPSVDTDILYEVAMDDAEPRIIQRPPRSNLDVEVHYGTIASGNQVMRHAAERDQVSREFGGVLCFEMEAAGLMNNFPSLVIRGICDYADVHKTKNWQEFAAATAAGYAKQLLCEVPRAEVVKIGAVNDRSGMKNRIVSLPFQRNYKFVGRDEILQELQKRLFLDEDCNDLAIYGLGGIGKTQIALAFANLIAKTQPDMSIFWIVALSHATVEKSFLDIAGQLRLTASSHSKEDIKIVVKHHLEDRDFGRWLLIVDNVDDESLVDLLLECVPGSDTGFKLYTSRSTRVVQDLVGGDAIEIERLGKVEALRLMSQSLLHCNAINDQTEMQSLCEELECLPLAMTQAAAYMNKNKISPGKYRELLKGADQDLIDLMSIENRDRTRYQQVGHAVATTWVVSFNQIMEQDTTAADLLKFISCVEWRDIPLPMLPKAGSNSQMTSAIGALCAYSFLTSSNHQETYNMHRLVHLATRIWVQTYDEASVIHTAVMAHMGAVFPPALWQNRADWRAFHPHAARLLRDYNGREDKGVARLCHSVGKSLLADWRTEEAIHWLETSQEVLIGLSDGDEYLLEVHHDLAEAWCDIHQELKAVQLLENVVAKRRSVLAEHHIDLVRSEILLADVYRSVGRWEEGLAMLERAAAVSQCMLAQDSPTPHVDAIRRGAEFPHFEAVRELAAVYLRSKAHDLVSEAVQMLERLVAIEARILSDDEPTLLDSQCTLGEAYLTEGKPENVPQAIQLLDNSVEMTRRMMPSDNLARLGPERNVALIYLESGRQQLVSKGVRMLEHVVEIQAQSLEKHDLDLLHSQRYLAEGYLKDDNTAEISQAVKLLEHVTNLLSQRLEHNNWDRLMSEHILATAYLQVGDPEDVSKAVKLLEQVSKVESQKLVEGDPSRLTSMYWLGRAYLQVGDSTSLSKAVVTLEHVTKIESQKLVEDDLSRLTSMHWLGRAYMQVGDSPSVFKALLVLQQVVSIRTRALAESDPYRLASEQELARAYLQTGWREATALAIELLEHVVEVDSKNLKDDDTSRAFSRSLLNEAYAARERLQQKDGKRNHVRGWRPKTIRKSLMKDVCKARRS